MQLSSLLVTGAALAGTASAYVYELTVPKTIKAGETFAVKGNQLISQPRDHRFFFGIGPSIYPFTVGGSLFKEYDYYADQQSGYNITMPGFTVPDYYPKGPAGIGAMVVSFSGLDNSPGLAYWTWNVTIGDETSTERVTAVRTYKS